MAALRCALAAALDPGRASGEGRSLCAEEALLLLRRLLATASACVSERVMQAAVAAGGGGGDEGAPAPAPDRTAALTSLYVALCPWEAPLAVRPPSAASTSVVHVGDGTSAAATAVTELFRALLPAVLACVARGGRRGGSLSLRACALLCLREFVAGPRVFTLRSDEAALVLEAVAASTSQAAALLALPGAPAPVRAPGPALAAASSPPQPRGPELTDIDVGRPAAVPGHAAPPPIVLSAARFCAALTEQKVQRPAASVDAAAAASEDGDDADELQAALWLLHSLIKYRRDAAVAAMPLLSHALQSAMARLPALALLPPPPAAAAMAARTASSTDHRHAAAALARLCEVFAEAIRPMRYHAVNVLAAGLCALAAAERTALAPRGAGAGALAAAAAAMAPPVYALFAACTRKELQQLHAALAPRPAARTLLKAMHRAYEERAKYRGS